MQYGGINQSGRSIRYHESSPFRDLRDADATGKGWKRNRSDAVQNYSNQQAISQLSMMVEKLKRRILGMSPPIATSYFPFKIYQPSNASNFTTGLAFLNPSASDPTVCNIDSTIPTNFSSVPPTINPTTDYWRFWSVRSGQVEVRPIFHLVFLGNGATSDGAEMGDPNNWAYKYNVNKNADGISPVAASNLRYDSATDKTINPPLIFAGTLDPNNPIGFAIWIEIAIDTASTLIGAKIAARTCNANQFNFAASGQYRIPVGVIAAVFSTGTGTYGPPSLVVQELFGHAINRFPIGTGTYGNAIGISFGQGGIMNPRGSYDSGSHTGVPPDLTNQIMYPGDVVFVFNSGTNKNEIYQFVGAAILGGAPAKFTNPITDTAQWQRIFSSTP